MPIVGLDLGTQSVKAVLLADDLSVLASAAEPVASSHPRPGWAEQEPRAWERALAACVPRALREAGVAPSEVRALGVAGQLDGCVAVDASGAPLGPCLIWMDRRAEGLLPELDPASFRRTTGLVADPSHMAAKIRWLARRGLPPEARFHQPVSYVVERLTGAAVLDHGLASTTMLYDLGAADWSPPLLEAFEIDRSSLPAIARATDVAGALTSSGAALLGLAAGTPVAVGTGDDFATPLGAGIARPGALACVLGTAEVVGAVSNELVVDDGGLVETHGWLGGGYFVENPGWLAGGAVSWLRALVGFEDDAALDAAAASTPPGADELLFLPALSGAMAPAWQPAARGCFYGLTPAHGRGHLARAVLEGCAFAMRDVLLRLGELGVATSPIVLVGGGARSELWASIRADVAARPVEIAATRDACPVGAGLLAAVAAGLVADIDTAAAQVAGRHRRVEPDPDRSRRYADAHARYRQLFTALAPLYA